MTELSSGSPGPEPTRWLDDPTLSGALKADLAHGASATVTGLDTSAGLVALRGAIAAQTGALAPAAASSSFGVKAVVGVLAIGGAIGLWRATTADAPRVEPVATVQVEPLEPVASELPRAAIPHEVPPVQPSVVAPQPEPEPEPASDVVTSSKRDDRRRDPASSNAVQPLMSAS